MNLNLTPLWQPSRREPIYSPRGAVAASQPLATAAGLDILKKGGNAVDAAIATAITIAVTCPSSNDVGGDAFALIWDGNKVHGINGSGRAPAAHTPALMAELGHDTIPKKGWLSVTIPGAVALWRDLHAKFGSLPFADLCDAAIHYAEYGYPVAPVTAFNWHHGGADNFAELDGQDFSGFADIFLPNGRAPRAGEMWQNPALAETLRRIATTNGEDFYTGSIAEKIVAFSQKTGGFLTLDDFAAHTSTWVDPISTSYRGYDVWEIPPNGQGLAALLGLNILEGFDVADHERLHADAIHLQIEAMKLGFVDAQKYVADPEFVSLPIAKLLDKRYAQKRRDLVGDTARLPEAGDPLDGGTVYFNTADENGMMVSFIQSNFHNFGAHVAVPETGICLQNRGSGFKLEEEHLNVLAAGKRPFHTIIPGFLTKDDQAIGAFGIMGGHMQPQGHLQTIVNTIDYGLNPQMSLDAPRWHWVEGNKVLVEPTMPSTIVAALRARGHDIQIEEKLTTFGNGQITWRMENGVYISGSDGRADGVALGY